ncbi:MAG: metallophosphoesterase [Opitutales bacterium]
MALAALLVCIAGLFLIPKKGVKGCCALIVFYLPQTLVWWWMLGGMAEIHPAFSGYFIALSWVGLSILLGHRVLTYGTTWRGHPLEIGYMLPMHVFQNAMLLQMLFWPLAVFWNPGPGGQTLLAAMPLLIGIVGIIGLMLPWRWVTHQANLRGLAKPIRVVHLSDLHLGPYFTSRHLDQLANEIQQRKPDLITITGDFLTQTTLRRYQPILDFVSKLSKQGRPILACIGNHDLPSVYLLTQDLETAGAVVLRNQGQALQIGDNTLWVSGVDYFSEKNPEALYAGAFEACRPSEDHPELLLCHDPKGYNYLPKDRSCLLLAGHLHGGQIGLNALGINWNLLTPFGLHNPGWHRKGRSQMFLHSGTGTYGFPARIGTRTEAVLLELTPDETEI